MFCGCCGAPGNSGDRFCSTCGTACVQPPSAGTAHSFVSPNSSQIAPLTRRFIALLLDLLAVVCLINIPLFFIPRQLLHDGLKGTWPAAAIPFFLCCLMFSYFVGFEALF